MKRFLLSILFCGIAFAVFSQGSVRYDIEPGIERLQNEYVSNWRKINSVSGYRIQVASFSGVNSKSQAETVKAILNTTMLGQRAYIVYIEPYFKVQFGDYFSRLQAYKDLVKIRETYPGAYIVPEKVNYK